MIANGAQTAEHRGAESLLRRLEDEGTVDALHRLLDRADLLAFAAEAVDGFMRRGDTIADSIGDNLRDAKTMIGSASPIADLAGQLPQLAATGGKVAKLSTTAGFQNLLESGLLEKLGDPATIQSLKFLFENLQLVSFSLQMLDSFIRRGDELVENLSGMVAEARKTGTGIEQEDLQALKETGAGLLSAAKQLQQGGALAQLPKLTESLLQLVHSGVFDPKTVNVLAEVGNLASASYVKTKAAKPAPVGPLSIYKALKDPDVQRVVGFLMEMTKQYGKTLR